MKIVHVGRLVLIAGALAALAALPAAGQVVLPGTAAVPKSPGCEALTPAATPDGLAQMALDEKMALYDAQTKLMEDEARVRFGHPATTCERQAAFGQVAWADSQSTAQAWLAARGGAPVIPAPAPVPAVQNDATPTRVTIAGAGPCEPLTPARYPADMAQLTDSERLTIYQGEMVSVMREANDRFGHGPTPCELEQAFGAAGWAERISLMQKLLPAPGSQPPPKPLPGDALVGVAGGRVIGFPGSYHIGTTDDGRPIYGVIARDPVTKLANGVTIITPNAQTGQLRREVTYSLDPALIADGYSSY